MQRRRQAGEDEGSNHGREERAQGRRGRFLPRQARRRGLVYRDESGNEVYEWKARQGKAERFVAMAEGSGKSIRHSRRRRRANGASGLGPGT